MIQAAHPRWYVVQTHPHAEHKASAHLCARDMMSICRAI